MRAHEAATGAARTPILALSANVMPHQIEDQRLAGMDAAVAEPIDLKALREALERAVQGEAQAAAA